MRDRTAWYRRRWLRPPTPPSRISIGLKQSCWNCTCCSCGQPVSSATEAWMSQSRCATRSPRNWRERASPRHVPAASRHLAPSGAQSAARSMASRCRRDCCLVQARMLKDKVLRQDTTAGDSRSATVALRFKVGLDKNLDSLLATSVNVDGYRYGLVVTATWEAQRPSF